ncbi:uncharacterized protein LOC116291444 [Actinia tenebrosa]|uniref:Uncharacterized protein LOC116291444 n=1 Tax=Actinia tenebrosa TaxID=6105 RepID=A0A6P8HHP2_ACTTE|nr:uncharacterized protein LOC116291444 [Actinia tenebrosa]
MSKSYAVSTAKSASKDAQEQKTQSHVTKNTHTYEIRKNASIGDTMQGIFKRAPKKTITSMNADSSKKVGTKYLNYCNENMIGAKNEKIIVQEPWTERVESFLSNHEIEEFPLSKKYFPYSSLGTKSKTALYFSQQHSLVHDPLPPSLGTMSETYVYSSQQHSLVHDPLPLSLGTMSATDLYSSKQHSFVHDTLPLSLGTMSATDLYSSKQHSFVHGTLPLSLGTMSATDLYSSKQHFFIHGTLPLSLGTMSATDLYSSKQPSLVHALNGNTINTTNKDFFSFFG